MSKSVQFPLPGMPLRVVVSAVWESAERPCTIRATVDVPSDDYSSQIIGADTEGRMTWDELQGAMETLLAATMGNADLLRAVIHDPLADYAIRG